MTTPLYEAIIYMVAGLVAINAVIMLYVLHYVKKALRESRKEQEERKKTEESVVW